MALHGVVSEMLSLNMHDDDNTDQMPSRSQQNDSSQAAAKTEHLV